MRDIRRREERRSELTIAILRINKSKKNSVTTVALT